MNVEILKKNLIMNATQLVLKIQLKMEMNANAIQISYGIRQ